MIAELIEDVSRCSELMPSDHKDSVKLRQMEFVLLGRRDFLLNYPTCCFQELYNSFSRAEDDAITDYAASDLADLAKRMRAQHEPARAPWLEAVFPYRPPNHSRTKLSVRTPSIPWLIETRSDNSILFVGCGSKIVAYDSESCSNIAECDCSSQVIAIRWIPSKGLLAALLANGEISLLLPDSLIAQSSAKVMPAVKGSNIVAVAAINSSFQSIAAHFDVRITRARRISTPAENYIFGDLACSSDGSLIAFAGGAIEGDESMSAPMIGILEIDNNRFRNLGLPNQDACEWSSLRFSANDDSIYALSMKQGLFRISFSDGSITKFGGTDFGGTHMDVSPNGKLIAVAGHSIVAVVTSSGDVLTQRLIADFNECTFLLPNTPVKFLSDSTLITGSCDGQVNEVPVEFDRQAKDQREFEKVFRTGSPILGFTLSSEGLTLACYDGHLNRVLRGESLFNDFPTIHLGNISDVAISHRGRHVASVCEGGFLSVLETSAVKIVRGVYLVAGLTSVRFSRDGEKILVGKKDGSLFCSGLFANDFSFTQHVSEQAIFHADFDSTGNGFVLSTVDGEVLVVDLKKMRMSRCKDSMGSNNFEYDGDGKLLCKENFVWQTREQKHGMLELARTNDASFSDREFDVLRHGVPSAAPGSHYVETRGLGVVVTREEQKRFPRREIEGELRSVHGGAVAIKTVRDGPVIGWLPFRPHICVLQGESLLAGSVYDRQFAYRIQFERGNEG